jgi:hypothetical protein
MIASKSANKVLDSRLVQVFRGRLKDWAEELQKCSDTIVAISRKAPRLIELMVREGFLSESVLSRVIAEQALPFLIQNDNSGFVVVDDAMTYGTTFKHVYNLTKQAQHRCGGNIQKLSGIPFAVGQEANIKYRELAKKYFLELAPEQIASFVNNEMLAFRLLGKPYDIEHPMLTWTGDFSDNYKLETALNEITDSLDSQKFCIETSVPTSENSVLIRRWTILLSANSRFNVYPRSDFRKLRIYLNPENNRLIVTAMCPVSLSNTDMDSFKEILPKPLNELWSEVAIRIDPKAVGHISKAGSYSLAMWANFLLEMVLLRDIKATFFEAFKNNMLQSQMVGPCSEDLQYLIGPVLCSRFESLLAQFLECENFKPVFFPPFDYANEIVEEKIPQEYAENYTKKLASLIEKALEVNDIFQDIFYTQHTDIEIPSRSANKDNIDDDDRLDFGITYSKLRKTILSKFPDVDEIDIHECLDKLIDNGAIVPRYRNMSVSDKSVIWTRTFRVGEGIVKQAGHTVRLLFEKLSAALGEKELPPLLFEKYCALALCVATDNNMLSPLQSLEIKKLFHLYGARPALRYGKKTEFLTDWAVNYNILSRSKSVGFSEINGCYSLQKDIDKSFPEYECPWDDDVKDGLHDLAALVVEIYKKHSGSELVALTSTATEKELQRALEAELQLWLYDYTTSVHHGLTKLSLLAEVADKNTPTEDELKIVNSVLSKLANFTAQVNIKHDLAKERQNIYEKIDKLVSTDDKIIMNRCWRKLKTTLNGRINPESNSSGLQEITSTLRIVHVTTRILRELLTVAGLSDSRSKGLEASLNLLQVTLDNPEKVDRVTRTIFSSYDSKTDITALVTIAKNQPLDDFKKAFPEIRKLIIEIANRCEQVLISHGIDQEYEKPEILPLPHYIMMWDIKDSTNEKNRDELESLIVIANRKIKVTFGNQIKGFQADSKDDSNSLACEKFADVLTIFRILNEVFHDKCFRAGCEVNLQGELKYYSKSESLGGRAFEYTARVMNFYKELKGELTRWAGDPVIPEPTDKNYMVVSEFAKRYAQEENAWPTNKTHIVNELSGTYKIRIKDSLPMSLTILQPVDSKPNGLEKADGTTNKADSIDLFQSL